MPTTAQKKTTQLLIEIKRHIAGPPRRSPGQRLWMSPAQIKAQGLKHRKDFIVVPPPPKPKPKAKAKAGSTQGD